MVTQLILFIIQNHLNNFLQTILTDAWCLKVNTCAKKTFIKFTSLMHDRSQEIMYNIFIVEHLKGNLPSLNIAIYTWCYLFFLIWPSSSIWDMTFNRAWHCLYLRVGYALIFMFFCFLSQHHCRSKNKFILLTCSKIGHTVVVLFIL